MIVDYVKMRENALALSEQGYIPVFGEFNDQLAEIVIECIWKCKSSGKTEVTLLIDSNGGWNQPATAIFAIIVESGLLFRGLVLGKAASNGFNILQRCKRREALAGSILMFHWGSQSLNNNELDALINGEQWVIEHAIEKEMATLRFISKRTGISEKELRKIARQERRYPAKFALKAGMIDAIVDELPKEISKALKKVSDVPEKETVKSKKTT